MKVLYVNTLFWGGGAEKVARQLYYGMKAKGIETFFVAGRYQKGDVPKEVKVIYHTFFERIISAVAGIVNHNFLFRTFIARREIIKTIKENEIDVVHFHNLHGNYIGPSDLIAIKRYCPNIVITMHDMWLLTGCCPHGMSCTKWKLGSNCKGCKGNEFLKHGTIRAQFYMKSKMKHLCNQGFRFVCPSYWLADSCKQSYLQNENILCIPNGLDLNRYILLEKEEVRKKYRFPTDKHILLFSAHNINSPYKGIRYLYEALKQIPDKDSYCLIVIGKLNENEKKLPFQTFYMGYVSDERKMNELYAAADLFIMPSMADTAPLSALESMASGTPVLAFKTGGIPEVVTEDVGWLVDAGDSTGLTEKIIEIFKDPETFTRKTGKCREYIEDRYSEEKMIEQYRRMYLEIAG